MIKKLFYLTVIFAISIACNNQSGVTEIEEETNMEGGDYTEVTIANFEEKAGELVGNQVKISGLVNHTCKHGGKRMFIIDEETEETVKIEAGDNIDTFESDLEGSIVSVNGIVTELVVDDTYLDEWEKEVMTESGEEHKIHDGEHEGEDHDHEGEGETEEDHHGSDLEKIENLRKQLNESGKGHLSFYSVECLSFEVVPPPTSENE